MNDRTFELEDLLETKEGLLKLKGLVKSEDPDALYVLALAHYDGDYVEKDRSRCAELLEHASELGHVPSTHDLGCFYYYGYGFPKEFRNPLKTEELLLQSAKAGYIASMIFLGEMYRDGNGVSKNITKAKELFSQGANLGSKEAKTLLERTNGT